ncbi:hypothetical protein FIU60_13085, partial [Enterococcus faecium]
LKTLYRKRTVIWPFYFYTIIRTLSFVLRSFLYVILKNIILFTLINLFTINNLSYIFSFYKIHLL